jgi:hypothetical protein
VVFGDIGTSPLYTLKTVLDLTGDGNRATVLGVLSLIVWTLIAITSTTGCGQPWQACSSSFGSKNEATLASNG